MIAHTHVSCSHERHAHRERLSTDMCGTTRRRHNEGGAVLIFLLEKLMYVARLYTGTCPAVTYSINRAHALPTHRGNGADSEYTGTPVVHTRAAHPRGNTYAHTLLRTAHFTTELNPTPRHATVGLLHEDHPTRVIEKKGGRWLEIRTMTTRTMR